MGETLPIFQPWEGSAQLRQLCPWGWQEEGARHVPPRVHQRTGSSTDRWLLGEEQKCISVVAQSLSAAPKVAANRPQPLGSEQPWCGMLVGTCSGTAAPLCQNSLPRPQGDRRVKNKSISFLTPYFKPCDK